MIKKENGWYVVNTLHINNWYIEKLEVAELIVSLSKLATNSVDFSTEDVDKLIQHILNDMKIECEISNPYR